MTTKRERELSEKLEETVKGVVATKLWSSPYVREVFIGDCAGGDIIVDNVLIERFTITGGSLQGNCVEPYVRKTTNQIILDKYLGSLTRADKSRVYDIVDRIDMFSRIKYGENLNQYCRDFKDIEKIITDLSKNKLGQFIKKIRDLQIIRMVTIDKGCEGSDSFLTFNPAIAINGHFDNKHIHSAWKDVIEEYSLVKRKKIKVPLHQDNIDSFIFGLTEEEVEERYPEYLKYYKRTKEKVMESLGGK